MEDLQKRSILKHFWVITGNWKIGGSIAGIEVMTKMFFYYFHERIWNKIEWGKNKERFI